MKTPGRFPSIWTRTNSCATPRKIQEARGWSGPGNRPRPCEYCATARWIQAHRHSVELPAEGLIVFLSHRKLMITSPWNEEEWALGFSD